MGKISGDKWLKDSWLYLLHSNMEIGMYITCKESKVHKQKIEKDSKSDGG